MDSHAPAEYRTTSACCCGGSPSPSAPLQGSLGARWTCGVVASERGPIQRVRTTLSARDRLGAVLARCGVGRMDYRIPPGLYAAGDPGPLSVVLVTANYKMSFDRLRRVLSGRNAWILVLETYGINVWCAAGKGTFGTDEIVRRVEATGLGTIVQRKTLVVPQLGAPGVAAHEVRARCGFRVVYGPIRAEDLPAFLDARMTASPGMRLVRFGLRDRLVLAPVELFPGGTKALLMAAVLALVGGLGPGGWSLHGVATTGLAGAALTIGAFAIAAVLGPALLPWLPGRAFAIKGAFLGLAVVGALAGFGWPGVQESWPHIAAWTLIVTSLASFVAMNFTGSSTFTSLSGVLREMRVAVPAQAAGALVGLALWVLGLLGVLGRPA